MVAVPSTLILAGSSYAVLRVANLMIAQRLRIWRFVTVNSAMVPMPVVRMDPLVLLGVSRGMVRMGTNRWMPKLRPTFQKSASGNPVQMQSEHRNEEMRR